MPLTTSDKARVLELHAEGFSAKEIASQLRRSAALVSQALEPETETTADDVESESGSKQPGKKQGSYGCDVRGCPNRKDDLDAEGLTISFFLFPKDPQQKKAWESATRRSSEDGKGGPWKAKSTSRICDEHFLPEDFKPNSAKKLLLDGVVPSVHFPGQNDTPEKRPLARTVRRPAASVKVEPPKEVMELSGPAASLEKPSLRPASSRIAARAAAGFAARVEGTPPAKKAKRMTPAKTHIPVDEGATAIVDPVELEKEMEDWRYYQKLEEDRQSSLFMFPQAVEEARRIEEEKPEGTSFVFAADKFVVTRVWFVKRDLRCRNLVVQSDMSVVVWEDGLKYAGHKVYGTPGTASSVEKLRDMISTLPDVQLSTTQDIIHLQSVVGRMLKKLKTMNSNSSAASIENENPLTNIEAQKEGLDGLLKFLEFSTEQLTLLSWPKHGRRFADQAPVTLGIATKMKQYSQPGYDWLKNTGPIVFPCGVTIERDLGRAAADETVVYPPPSSGHVGSGLRVTVAVPHAFPAIRPSPEPQHLMDTQ